MFPKRLLDGYFSFRNGKLASEKTRYKELATSGQNPEIMIIGCCDSRVSPELIFDSKPGEMFVVRNVANLVPPYDKDPNSSYHGTSAAIEFAVSALNIKHIVVLGHESCGGIKSFIENKKPLSTVDFIGKWMSQIAPVSSSLNINNQYNKENSKKLELGVISHSINNLLTFPSIKAKINNGSLAIHGAYFLISTGDLLVKNYKTDVFDIRIG
ncbi:carbonic anhydrase [Candidatus Kinetoplastidibacterium crithidiae]|uniref:Carbonic anhydrase n=1 Tax=Candidatus Kinetoplastidibacterium crithidiae TCC036E TaxID=1208918 RepID=M1LTF0_9PROT|nr:carbonic anhydrase [Candidatus Kinetoplastibacterium crithidii]AFZ83099.1 carbonic anhydrase [Candidatus Kinetoplastibacterium crithidii (ex Angomonas deanei ATCC 30255)]AGF47376.1 carbonic anhydrase [Candidatus Kinetoplastibacterium crithidii TCC036E]